MAEIRAAIDADAAGIRAVHLAAFPTPLEADLVERLTADGDAIVSLVALDRGAVIGHILFSRMTVVADECPLHAFGLAPVAVLPRHQRAGVGSALIERGLQQARSLGAQLVFVLGEPDYYGRFGFTAGAAAPFESPYAGPYFQARRLGGTLDPASGRADYARAFRELA